MTYKHNDGGSARSPNSGYCAVRALAIANEMEWSNAERHIRKFAKVGKGGNGTISKGVYKEDFDSALNVLGWYWVKAPIIIGRKARAKDLAELISQDKQIILWQLLTAYVTTLLIVVIKWFMVIGPRNDYLGLLAAILLTSSDGLLI